MSHIPEYFYVLSLSTQYVVLKSADTVDSRAESPSVTLTGLESSATRELIFQPPWGLAQLSDDSSLWITYENCWTLCSLPQGQLQLPKSASLEFSIAILTFARRVVTAQRINRQPRHVEWAGIQPSTLSQYWLCRQAVHKPSRHAEMGWCQQPWLSWVRLSSYPSKSDRLGARTSNFCPFTNAMPGGAALYSLFLPPSF